MTYAVDKCDPQKTHSPQIPPGSILGPPVLRTIVLKASSTKENSLCVQTTLAIKHLWFLNILEYVILVLPVTGVLSENTLSSCDKAAYLSWVVEDGAAELNVLWVWLKPPKSKLSDLGKDLNGTPPPVDKVRPKPVREVSHVYPATSIPWMHADACEQCLV